MPESARLCAVCDSSHSRLLFEKAGYAIMRCARCGFKYAEFSGSHDFYRDFYTKEYFENGHNKYGYADYLGDESNHLRINGKRARFVEQFVQGGRILDIGCAAGFFLDCLGPSWDKYGCEPSTAMAELAREKYGDRITAASSEEYESHHSFDVITAWDVIEHVIDLDSFMHNIRALLKEDGYFFLSTPDAISPAAVILGKRWYHYIPPSHLQYFGFFTITRFLKKHGFRKLKLRFFTRYFSLAEILLNVSYMVGSSRLRSLSEGLSESSVWNFSIPYNVCDELTVASRRIPSR